jgi:hypothetical protein
MGSAPCGTVALTTSPAAAAAAVGVVDGVAAAVLCMGNTWLPMSAALLPVLLSLLLLSLLLLLLLPGDSSWRVDMPRTAPPPPPLLPYPQDKGLSPDSHMAASRPNNR